MENIHDILSSFHSRLRALEGNLGVRAIDGDQRKSLEEIAPYVCRHAHKAWYIMPDVRTNYSGGDPFLIGHGYINGERIEIRIRCNPNHNELGADNFEVKFLHIESSEEIMKEFRKDAISITELLDRAMD